MFSHMYVLNTSLGHKKKSKVEEFAIIILFSYFSGLETLSSQFFFEAFSLQISFKAKLRLGSLEGNLSGNWCN